MTSALLVAAYFMMLLSSCVVAEWGDLLTFRWVPAVRLRRRTRPQESWLECFSHERHNLSLAAEADFLARYELFDSPKPFIVFRHLAPVETPAFLAARRRVAARLSQLAVAQKLREDAAAQDPEEQNEPDNIVTLPPDVPANEVPAILLAAGDTVSGFAEYLDDLYPELETGTRAATVDDPHTLTILAYEGLASPTALATGPPHHALAEIVSINGRRGHTGSPPPSPPGSKSIESSEAIVIAA